MKIAIVVQGRFHAAELTKAVIARGHDVTLFINYPRWAIERFGVPRRYVQSFALHGVLSRLLRGQRHEPLLTRLFGIWAAHAVHRQRWDLIHVFSTAAEEILIQRPGRGEVIEVMRACSHIRYQDELMQQESLRCGVPVPRPLPWTMAREEREYALADRIVTLSNFAYRSFLRKGFSAQQLQAVPLAAETELFKASAQQINARCDRIRGNRALRVLFVGTVSYRKGMFDLIEIAKRLPPERFDLRAAGSIEISPEHQQQLSEKVQCLGRLAYETLPQLFAWGDVFIFPTIEDGFAIVLAQALAAGLPVLTTSNSGGPDLIDEARNGWILPIRTPQAFVDKLLWMDQNRESLAQIVAAMPSSRTLRTWEDVVRDMETPLSPAALQANTA